MKYLAHTRNIFSSDFLTPLKWKRLNDYLKAVGYWLVSYWSAQSLPGECISQTQIPLPVGRVVRDLQAGLAALVLSATANKRLYVGLVLIGIVAPLSGCSYMLFDRSVRVEGWYYLNNFYLFMVLGPSITEAIICVGAYHLFPSKSKRAFLLSIPMGFAIGKIIWLCSVSSNEQFYEVAPSQIVFVGILISLVVLFSVEWFAWRNEHRFRAFCSRTDSLDNIVDEPSISDAKFRSMFKTIYQEKKNFPKQY